MVQITLKKSSSKSIKWEKMCLSQKIRNIFISKKYKCSNCDSPIPKWIVRDCKFNVCPVCGELYPQTKEYIENYFRIIQLSDSLEKAKNLIIKGEYEASVRESVVVFESLVKNKSGLPKFMGSDLMARAFSYKKNDNGTITEFPKIQVNGLSTISEINEQEGLKYLSMGVMSGIRNIYMHGPAEDRIYLALQIVSFINFLIQEVNGVSMTRQ